MIILKSYLSEIYLFIAIIYYWSLTVITANWIAIVLFLGINLLFSILLLFKYAKYPSKELINLPNKLDL